MYTLYGHKGSHLEERYIMIRTSEKGSEGMRKCFPEHTMIFSPKWHMNLKTKDILNFSVFHLTSDIVKLELKKAKSRKWWERLMISVSYRALEDNRTHRFITHTSLCQHQGPENTPDALWSWTHLENHSRHRQACPIHRPQTNLCVMAENRGTADQNVEKSVLYFVIHVM